MITQEEFKRIEKKVRASKRDPKLSEAPVVAHLTGPAVIIEMIMLKVKEETGYELDWGYAAGIAMVYSYDNKEQIRRHIFWNIPHSDVTEFDL